MRSGWPLALGGALACLSAPLYAGEEPLYDDIPDWVEPAEIDRELLHEGPSVLVADNQKRLENGTVWDYRDLAYRIESPEALNAAGTLNAAWIPDKGDLIIHKLQILRDGGEVVDVIGGGARFTVLRREQMLERREINGLLTATLAVPGLRVGDVIRLSFSSVQADQVLEDKVQSIEALESEPSEIGFARTRISWPENEPMAWKITPDIEDAAVELRDGYKVIEIDLPLPERPEVPGDAPMRFKRPPMLQVGSFSSWREVSRIIAPHFATEGTIDPDGEIANRLQEITRSTDDPLERAAAALRTVQDDISYLLNGLNGGNYLPQTPSETWEMRYGDCKAKSLLLLAMLRAMDIESEAVLVHSSIGDAVPELLPMLADFDHIIVRATIDGTDYWLDGTSTGTRLDNIGRVPAFGHALPLRSEGADLVEVVQRDPVFPDRTVILEIDQSAGIDLPAIYHAETHLTGLWGGQARGVALQRSDDLQEEMVDRFMQDIVGENHVLTSSMHYDEESATTRILATGLLPSGWTFEQGRADWTIPALPSSDFGFSPDRARREWRDIPVQRYGPYLLRTEVNIALPDEGEGFELRGRESLESLIAGAKIERDAAIREATLSVTETFAQRATEVAPADISAEKAKAARFSAGTLSLRAPTDTRRAWEYDTKAEQAALKPLKEAYKQLVEVDPEDASRLTARASFRISILDWEGALADVDAALEIEPTVRAWRSRADLLSVMGKQDEALAAARSAFELEPTPTNALVEAQFLADTGEIGEALALVEVYEDDFEDRSSVIAAKADLLGRDGRAEEGLQLLDGLLRERPGDPVILNHQCWLMGIWKVREEEMLGKCIKAVEGGGWAPPVLDSRAMAYYRLGRLEEALTDLNAALAAAPGLANSLFMRGIVRTGLGDEDGRKDIEDAVRINPGLPRIYALYGIGAPD